MKKVLEKLSGGDLRSEGKAEEVAQEIITNPEQLSELIQGVDSDNKVVRGRTYMTLEIISRQHPELITGVMSQMIELAAVDTVPQVRWHIAEIIGNVEIPDEKIDQVFHNY